MFQTIGHKSGGFVQLTTIGNKTTIKAWSHGELLGDSYETVAGAKCAITRHHRKWLGERRVEHNRILAYVECDGLYRYGY